MPQKRLATLSPTTSYQNLGVLLTSLGFSARLILTAGALKIPSAASFPVRISIVQQGATTGSDSLSNNFVAGDQMSFTELNCDYVWIKGNGGASTLEVEGDDAS